MSTSTLTKRGQISVPAALRKAMGLIPGQSLEWTQISDREFRVRVENPTPPGPLAVLGYARKLHPEKKMRRTGEWMRELRTGESAD